MPEIMLRTRPLRLEAALPEPNAEEDKGEYERHGEAAVPDARALHHVDCKRVDGEKNQERGAVERVKT